MLRNKLLATTALCALLAYLPAPALATDRFDFGAASNLPAVSSPNGKVAAGGGGFDDNGFGFVEGSYSLPVSHNYGLQFDGLAGGARGGGLFGGGAHLFWRDPRAGLLGIYGSGIRVNGSRRDYTHFAVAMEGHAYMGAVSLETLLGYEGGDDKVEKGFMAIGDLAYYASNDLKLYAGIRYIQKDVLGAGGIEYQLPSSAGSGIALFGEGRINDEDRWQAWGGIRFYLGEHKSLIRRHREDDPNNHSKEFLFEVDTGDGVVTPTGGNNGQPECEINDDIPCQEPEG